ncbi:hypothetical protein LT493_12285 [Streptomyces tricolor]|nr:hypothetical protein [Streptomyces tricolor]
MDLTGAALPVAAAIVEVHEPHPLRLAAVAALVWPLIRVAGKRYTSSRLGRRRWPARAVLRDWLLLVGALATLRVCADCRASRPRPSRR